MSAVKWAVPFVVPLLFGCGLRVPDIQELGDRTQGHELVQAIITNISCELRQAVVELRKAYPKGTFLDSWGIQTTLTFIIDEKGTIAPGVSWMPPSPMSAIFTLGAGANLSSEATRTNKINAYYLVSELKKAPCPAGARPNGLFLLQSDLKLSEWLFYAVSAAQTNTINFNATTLAVKENVLQHQVKFEIVSSGTINPKWELTRVTVNPSGNLFSAGRTRTHDLLITLGPAVEAVTIEVAKNGRRKRVIKSEPSLQAFYLHQSSVTATGIENAVRNALQQ